LLSIPDLEVGLRRNEHLDGEEETNPAGGETDDEQDPANKL
jgi:hypothetical protein